MSTENMTFNTGRSKYHGLMLSSQLTIPLNLFKLKIWILQATHYCEDKSATKNAHTCNKYYYLSSTVSFACFSTQTLSTLKVHVFMLLTIDKIVFITNSRRL